MVFTCCCTGDPLTSSHRNPLFKKKKKSGRQGDEDHGAGVMIKHVKETKAEEHGPQRHLAQPKAEPHLSQYKAQLF